MEKASKGSVPFLSKKTVRIASVVFLEDLHSEDQHKVVHKENETVLHQLSSNEDYSGVIKVVNNDLEDRNKDRYSVNESGFVGIEDLLLEIVGPDFCLPISLVAV